MKKLRSCLITACVFVVVLGIGVRAQDPGAADTVRLGSDSATVWQRASIPIYLFNDEAISSITIPLLVDGYSGWATFDSVSFVGGRLSNLAVLDVRQVEVVETDTFSVEKLIIRFEVGGGANLPVGNGKLCELWFRPWFGGTVAIDTSGNSIASELKLVDESSNTIGPEFRSGEIQIWCDYLIADIDDNGIQTTSDLVAMYKVLYGHYSFWYQASYAQFDLNGDRHVDLKDIAYMTDWIFAGGSAPSLCGNYIPSAYGDTGIRDTLSVSSDTLYVGVTETLQFNLANDDSIRSFAFAFEWDGTGSLQRASDSDNVSLRILPTSGMIGDVYGYGNVFSNGVNPDTCHMAHFPVTHLPIIREGSGTILFLGFKAIKPGTVTFMFLDHYNDSYAIRYLKPPETMLLRFANNAYGPVFISGVITILPVCGDADGSGVVNVSDAVFLVNYIFAGGAEPYDIAAGDPDCNGLISISDAVYLINYIFGGGAAPCASCT